MSSSRTHLFQKKRTLNLKDYVICTKQRDIPTSFNWPLHREKRITLSNGLDSEELVDVFPPGNVKLDSTLPAYVIDFRSFRVIVITPAFIFASQVSDSLALI